MSSPPAVHHALLRPCVLHILRAAGYHSTKPSVLDTLTDIAARYMVLLARSTVKYAHVNHSELEISIEDVRMAMQECGILIPEKVIEDQDYEGEEDTRGVDCFIAWAMGPANKEIIRVALEGADDDAGNYLDALMKKFDKSEDTSRYHGTILGASGEPRHITVEGGDVTSITEWAEKLRKRSEFQITSKSSSRRQSSDLSSLGDQSMDGMDV
ncbi:MAG: hypothetical protein M1818_002106 [Claussenomyces sp. TS43310]|nr:MAG: hypothetical protein M1818_002106 [Claussenomyces sp. TS43310]